ncbi:MAG: Ni/Fe hydrogenase subunit alpha [Bacteroidota bacterium]|nr:Ni/Fe hydrogenase subunit alpha [Bacteroidota bacterium]
MKLKTGSSKILKVDYLARVEGEGGLLVKIKDDKVTEVKFRIFEPPRFFEAFLRGRKFMEAPDITARICGICPVAYQMSSSQAMENVLGVKVDGQLRNLRRLLYCGEWIESHALHVYMLHAPDFLGFEDALQIAQKHPDIVKRGLEIKKIGNMLMTIVGGREIHPINPRVGGFHRVSYESELKSILQKLKWALEASIETVKWTSTFNFPDFEQDYEFVSLRHPDEYPITDGRLVSNKGLDISIQEFEKHFIEEHVEHSNALHSIQVGGYPYHVGPLARYNLNFDRLPLKAQKAAKAAGLERTCNNPFKSIIVRSVELVFACEEAIRLIQEYQRPEKPFIEIHPKAGTGHGCTEAPRGILYHRYWLDYEGTILDAKIVPPTSQNQKMIERDIFHYVQKNLKLPEEKLAWQCEQTIRNYDPCISCATHFLKLKIE